MHIRCLNGAERVLNSVSINIFKHIDEECPLHQFPGGTDMLNHVTPNAFDWMNNLSSSTIQRRITMFDCWKKEAMFGKNSRLTLISEFNSGSAKGILRDTIASRFYMRT